MQYKISPSSAKKIFEDIFFHHGWSEWYQKKIIVEPVWYFKINNSFLTDFVCLDSILYDFKETFGNFVTNELDEEASEFQDIEQILIRKKDVFLICDNPMLFPHNRLKDFANYLAYNPQIKNQIGGIIHYHIDEPELSEEDEKALSIFFREINMQEKVPDYMALVISQRDPDRSLQLSNKSAFIDRLFEEFKEKNILISGKYFSSVKIHNVEVIL